MSHGLSQADHETCVTDSPTDHLLSLLEEV